MSGFKIIIFIKVVISSLFSLFSWLHIGFVSTRTREDNRKQRRWLNPSNWKPKQRHNDDLYRWRQRHCLSSEQESETVVLHCTYAVIAARMTYKHGKEYCNNKDISARTATSHYNNISYILSKTSTRILFIINNKANNLKPNCTYKNLIINQDLKF